MRAYLVGLVILCTLFSGYVCGPNWAPRPTGTFESTSVIGIAVEYIAYENPGFTLVSETSLARKSFAQNRLYTARFIGRRAQDERYRCLAIVDYNRNNVPWYWCDQFGP